MKTSFTGHKNAAIHLKMLAHDYPFDTVQMPLNCFDGTYCSFEQQVLPEVQRRGIAALGMKSLGGDGQPILHGAVSAEEAGRPSCRASGLECRRPARTVVESPQIP